MMIKTNEIRKSIVLILIPLIMCANVVIVSVSGLNLYLNLVVIAPICLFPFFYRSSKCRIPTLIMLIDIIIFFLNVVVHRSYINGDEMSNLIIFTCFILLIIAFRNMGFDEKKLLIALLIGIFLSVTRIFIENAGNLFSFSIHSRYDAGFIGAINNFAYLVTFAIAIAYYYIPNKFLKTIIIIYLILFNALTLSRGAIVILALFFIYVFFKTSFKKKFLFSFFFLTILLLFGHSLDPDLIARYNIFSNIGESSFGRTIIWNDVFSKLTNIKTLLIGAGSGTYKYQIGNDFLLSTHNQYLDFIYSFGVFFGLYFILQYFYVLYKVGKLRKTHEAIFVLNMIYALSFVFDSRLWTIQTFWIFSILLGISLNIISNEKKENLPCCS